MFEGTGRPARTEEPLEEIAARPRPLTDARLAAAVAQLAERDPGLAAIARRLGVPPMWSRDPGFGTLVHIILEQQVSIASARAAYDRLRAVVDPLTPAGFLEVTDAELLAIGFSRQKARYVRCLATDIVRGELDLDTLVALDDAAAHDALVGRTGIGPWTASIYLLMVLGRPDAWPAADIALAAAIKDIRRLDRRPTTAEMLAIGEAWRPWRAVAARLLWHHYLNPLPRG